MCLRPKNTEQEHASIFPKPALSITQDMGKFKPAGGNLDRSIARMAKRGESTALRESGNRTIDLSGYRGNLYKQTLSPSWSKDKLR